MHSMFYLLCVMAAGYLFCHRVYPLKITLIRKSGHHLYFYTFGWGVFVFFIAVFAYYMWNPRVVHESLALNKIIEKRVFEICTLTILMAYPLALLINGILRVLCFLFCDYAYKVHFNLMAAQASNDLERTIVQSQLPDSLQVLTVSMSSRKVYIGWVYQSYDPGKRGELSYMTLYPLLSGYRRDNDLKLVITHRYLRQFSAALTAVPSEQAHDTVSGQADDKALEQVDKEQADEGALGQSGEDDLEVEMLLNYMSENKHFVVLPVSEIVSIAPFSYEIYRSMEDDKSID